MDIFLSRAFALCRRQIKPGPDAIISGLIGLTLGLLVLFMTSGTIKAAELIMLEQAGCSYCEVWEEEVGDVYAITDEGKQAPLKKIDIHEPIPQKYKDMKLDIYTPTFIVWHEGKEIGRIRGYMSEDFFWPLLEEILQKIPQS